MGHRIHTPGDREYAPYPLSRGSHGKNVSAANATTHDFVVRVSDPPPNFDCGKVCSMLTKV